MASSSRNVLAALALVALGCCCASAGQLDDLAPGHVRELTFESDHKGQMGLVLINDFRGSTFAAYVEAGSPAAKAGLRFGDQIISRNDQLTTGKELFLSKLPASSDIYWVGEPYEKVSYVVRKSPFEQTVELAPGDWSQVGITLIRGKIFNVEKDSNAARAGLLTDMNIIKVNGKYVIGLEDDAIKRQLKESAAHGTTLTLLPSSEFEQLTGWINRYAQGDFDQLSDWAEFYDKEKRSLKIISVEGNKIVEGEDDKRV